MELGYIKMYRKTLTSRVFGNEGLLKVWLWCLLKASHKERWVSLKTGKGVIEVKLLPGQFILGRESAAKKLKMKPSTVWDRMRKLKNMQNLDIKTNRQYSVISIVNWDTYQAQNKTSDSEANRQPTGNQQATDTNKNVDHVKPVKNKKTFHPNSIEFGLSELLLNSILQRRNGFKKQDLQKWAKHIDLMLRVDNRDAKEIEKIIMWCQKDPFWQKNILSTSKLRIQYDQLAMKMDETPEHHGYDHLFDPDGNLKPEV